MNTQQEYFDTALRYFDDLQDIFQPEWINVNVELEKLTDTALAAAIGYAGHLKECLELLKEARNVKNNRELIALCAGMEVTAGYKIDGSYYCSQHAMQRLGGTFTAIMADLIDHGRGSIIAKDEARTHKANGQPLTCWICKRELPTD